MEIINNKLIKPKDGILGLKENWKEDMLSGFLVFLIALPLCLGIAMASGFPPIGGIITAIIGGLVVSPIMGSRVSIKGPAAGLIAIAMAAVMELGQGDALAGYKYTLAIVVIAGIVQILFGLLKLGRFVDFFPTAAVHGMLAAIGIIIIAKQIPVMLGVTPDNGNPIALLLEIPKMLSNLNPEIALIGGVSLIILFGLPLVKYKWAKIIPTPMLVLLIAMPLGTFFDLNHQHEYLFLDHHYFVGPKFLVTLPSNILDGITFPDFGKIVSMTSLKYVVMFALVGSLESLLTVKAVDGLDPYRRKSNSNRDLLAVGAGNTLSGLIGGLPMIAEVVRSSANVGSGAKTRWSNFFHGLFLLVFVAFFPDLIHRIPLTALAAMLIFTGFRLASPKLFKETLNVGKEQLIVFLTTIVVTLAEDLLVGIAAGIIMEIAVHLYRGVPFKSLFKSDFHKSETESEIRFSAKNAAIFTNYLGFKRQIDALPLGKNVVVDFQLAKLIDHTFMEQITHFKHDYEEAGGTVALIGMDHLTPVAKHALSARKVINY
ncbi:SulP family inorganic anion transporter [Fulvivirgaceae bacterium LMO-SS25]